MLLETSEAQTLQDSRDVFRNSLLVLVCAGHDDVLSERTFVVSLFLSESAAWSLWLAGPSIVPCSRESRSNLML